MINKKILTGAFFVFAILLITFVSSASIASPQFSVPGSSSLRSLGVSTLPSFSEDSCKAGQDFIVQIAPFGCTPKVVRSDLLEDQNVPVFCQLAATQINPLVKVNAIDSISFKGEYPKEISGIGFYPAQAAIKSTNTKLLNSPILENIGYAVIVLNQQPNELAMPDFIEGNLTARIRYDLTKSFGVGSATYYLPELNGQQWNEKFAQYGFWNGKGFLRAESIDTDSSQISVYLDKENKLSTFNLEKGQTSTDIFLPGLYCRAGLKVRLDGLENPDTKAKFDINGDVIEAGEKQKFLENKCQVRSVDKQGLLQSVEISCSTDTGSETSTLRIAPKIKLSIDGSEREVSVGELLYREGTIAGDRSVYVGYIGIKEGSNNEEDLFVYLVSLPIEFARDKNQLSDSELSSIATIARGIEKSDVPTIGVFFKKVGKIYASSALSIWNYINQGEAWEKVTGKEVTVYGKKVKIGGLTIQDSAFKNNDVKKSYENAMDDYRIIINQFPNERENIGSTETFGERALVQMIDLAENLKQMKTVKELCIELNERYPNTNSKPNICRDFLKVSNSAASELSVIINGNIKVISFEGISEPTLEDFSAEIMVEKGKTTNILTLRKNQVVFLDDAQKESFQLLDLAPDSAMVKTNFGTQTITTTESYNFVIRGEAEVLAAVKKLDDGLILASAQKIDNGLEDRCKPYVRSIVEASNANGIDPLLLLSLMIQESSCNQNADSGGTSNLAFDQGASYGLMQISGRTWCGKHGLSSNPTDCKNELLTNPEKNIEVGAKILKGSFDNPRSNNRYKCDAFNGKTNGGDQNEKAIDKTYVSWENALRSYNGWGCASGKVWADHDFVEKIMERFTQLAEEKKSLFEAGLGVIKKTTGIDLSKASLNKAGKEIIQGLSLSASGERTLKRGVSDNFGSQYIFTLTKVNLKKVAKVSVVPNIKNAGTEANFSFKVEIDKRAIQLSPATIKNKIDNLNQSIEKWEDTSEKIGEVVETFNAACLLTGAGLTVKNFVENTDGKAIARQQVMRGSGGYRDICTKEIATSGKSMDKCLLDHSDDIEKAVDKYHKAIQNQQAITLENVGSRLEGIKGDLNLDCSEKDQDVCEALSQKGYDSSQVTLTQARDLETLNKLLSENPNDQFLGDFVETNKKSILTQIEKNSKNFAEYTSIQGDLGKTNTGVGVNSYSLKDTIKGRYSGGEVGQVDVSGTLTGLSTEQENFPAEVAVLNGKKYLLILENTEGNEYAISKAYEYQGIDNLGKIIIGTPTPDVAREFGTFTKFDKNSYSNRFISPEAKYYETTQFKGRPAIVPFDIQNGWYAATRPTIGVGGDIRAFDNSGQVSSFWICNVGENGIANFNQGSLGTGDDICQQYNPGIGSIYGEFPGLSPPETSKLVSRAQSAISEASRQYKQGVGVVRIAGQNIKVGTPAANTPDTQCSDFMSPKDCNLLFNVCDPVICPSSRCNLGGTYHVPNVIQSGIVGSLALCLPNAKEDIAVPICLSGVKAGLDGFVSLQKSYRSCLQENLDTGKTIGICDEIHSIYLCDFFWQQAGPISQALVPTIFDLASGKTTSRGGGEYLALNSAWKNAGDSVDYLTQFYGANLFSTFKSRSTQEVGSALCKGFISGTVPSVIDSLIEPRSPVQYTAWFSEQTFTTATVPATSQYKVFYHIYAGENNNQNSGAFYNVFLKSNPGSSFYQTNPTLTVATGFIKKGEFASETKDFTAPTGYQEVCVNVNGQEQCGFQKVTTEFALNYLNDLAIQDQASQTDIKSEGECVSGTPSAFGLINPNLQSGVSNAINPQLYNQGIVRICSTDNPGKGTEPGRWKPIGTCDNGRGDIKCYLDSTSVREVIQSTSIENETLKTAGNLLTEELLNSGKFLQEAEFDKLITELNKLREDMNYLGIISRITDDIIKKAFLNFQKAKLYLFRGDAHGGLAGEGKIDVAISGFEQGEQQRGSGGTAATESET